MPEPESQPETPARKPHPLRYQRVPPRRESACRRYHDTSLRHESAHRRHQCTPPREARARAQWGAWAFVIALYCICSMRAVGAPCVGNECATPLPSECREPVSLCTAVMSDGVALIDAGHPASIVADAHDFPGVLRAVRGLRSDLSAVAGMDAVLYDSAAAVSSGALIIVGTLGRDALIDRLVEQHKLDVTGVKGQWEAYVLQVVERPLPGVERALVIAGADRRGSIFGAYELSRRLGVSPWTWWADVPVARHALFYASPGRFMDKPVVRYRGIFLNDEDPALSGWARQTFGGFNHRFYEHVFELILRLKGNFLWPAMWGKAFADDDPQNALLANEMGIVMGTSHHEPMMRAQEEWTRYGKGPWDYTKNAARLREFWRAGIERMGANESLVTIGMRGDGDKPMTQGTAVGLLERIVADQRRIIASVTHRPAAQTPQVWALYKEVQDYYDQGMRVPEDVTLLFSDDNWGNLRRVPAPGAKRAGGYGIYYHFDYVGGPRSYKWLNTNQIERTWEQLRIAYEHGVDRIWIVNVGDLKPMEFPISFFLDDAWDPAAMTQQRLADYPRLWAAQQFGRQQAAAIGSFLTQYTQFNARRKPELLAPDTYSLSNYHEAERVLSEYNALAWKAEQVGNTLPPQYRDAYFELVLYPIEACANLNEMYVAAGLNAWYASQGRAATNEEADRVASLFARDADLTRQYHEDIAGGRWNHMMSQTHIGYTGWREPPENLMPAVRRIELPADGKLGVSIEGDTRAWPDEAAQAELPELSPFSADAPYVEIFNRGRRPLHFSVTAAEPWLHLSQTQGGVTTQTRVDISVDWKMAPYGHMDVPITISGGGDTVTVMAPVNNPSMEGIPADAHVEANGYVAVDARHFQRAVGTSDARWSVVPLGRTGSAVEMFPSTAPAQQPGGATPHLEYVIYLFHPGSVQVEVTTAPSLDFTGGAGLRYAISVDGEAPRTVNINAQQTRGAWERWVADDANRQTTTLLVKTAGAHTLKLWRVDPGVAFEKLVLATRKLPESYLGPPATVLPCRVIMRCSSAQLSSIPDEARQGQVKEVSGSRRR